MGTIAMEAIRNRYSVRTYSGEPLSTAEWGAVQARLAALSEQHHVRLALLKNEYEGRQFGTYGMIRQPAAYMLAVCRDEKGALIDAGMALEKAVIDCTAMGLGSCWLGGSFKRGEFGSKVVVGEAERIPAVIPVGRPRAKPRWVDGIVRSVAKSDQRLPFGALFFDGAFGRPLTASAPTSPQHEALEMVRLGPSASNKQPWRVIAVDGVYHFYQQHTKAYEKMPFDMQLLDMGIAMAHFELAMREQSQPGDWCRENPQLPDVPEGCEYIVSWKA